MSTLFRGITKTVPSLFRGIFSEQNFDGNPTRKQYATVVEEEQVATLRTKVQQRNDNHCRHDSLPVEVALQAVIK
jgi:hypothetical protein